MFSSRKKKKHTTSFDEKYFHESYRLLRPLLGVDFNRRFLALLVEIDLSDFASQSLKSTERSYTSLDILSYFGNHREKKGVVELSVS